jgi:hypothetical protein
LNLGDNFFFVIIGGIDAGVDVTDYVICKIKSLCAQVDEDEIDGMNKRKIYLHLYTNLIIDFESDKFKNATKKFHKFFNVPADEKLVTCEFSYKIKSIVKIWLFFYRLFLFVLAWSCTSSRLAVFIG